MDAKDKNGRTAMMLACLDGHSRIVKVHRFLLSYQALTPLFSMYQRILSCSLKKQDPQKSLFCVYVLICAVIIFHSFCLTMVQT